MNLPLPNSPHVLTKIRVIDTPLPTHRLASSALRALQVDAELSPLVRRTFSLVPLHVDSLSTVESTEVSDNTNLNETIGFALRTSYKATTNRMLRVAVNGFMESLRVILGVMAELDVDVLDEEHSA
jgi:EKC/KEOPS complex subunit PCC1/LAGE3